MLGTSKAFKAIRNGRTSQAVNGTAANDLRKSLGKQGVDVVNDHAEILEEMQQWARAVAVDVNVLKAEVAELRAFKAAVIAQEPPTWLQRLWKVFR